MASNKVTIQETNKGQFFITLPKSIIRFKKWEKGNVLEISESGINELLIRKVG